MPDQKDEVVDFYIGDRGQKSDEVKLEAALLCREWEKQNSGELRDPSFKLDYARGYWVARYGLIRRNGPIDSHSARFGDSA